MNPFMSRFPVERREEWFGSQHYFQELDACIEQKVNAVILEEMLASSSWK